MTVVWYYVLPMLLGRTYDMRTDSPGIDIFPESEIDNAAVIQRHFTDSQYRLVMDSQEARDFLDVTGDLSLKIKAGRVNIEGLGNYMKESYSRSNMVEILVKVHFETMTYTLPSTAKPRSGWKTLDKVDVGTHYVRSITYGGDLVASLRFIAKHSADRENIRAVVQANLQADSGSFGLGIAGNFSQLQEDLKDSSTLEINYYATVPIKSVPNTMESLIDLVEGFPEQTKLVNNGTGVPLRMELFPLTAIDSEVPRYLETKALVDQLDRLESQFDDIRATKRSLQEWLLNVPPVLTQELEDEVGEFNAKLESISAVFYNVLGNMDMSEGANGDQFLPAFVAYEGEAGSLPDKYYRKLILLKDKIVKGSPELSLDIGGTSYTHYGTDNCSSSGSSALFTGILVTTDRVKGGSAQIICLQEEPQWDADTTKVKRHQRFFSKLAPVKFHGRNAIDDKPISCAFCFVGDRTATTTFSVRDECPAGWTLEYKGYMMTKDFKSRKGDFVCVDTDSKVTEKSVLVMSKSDKNDYIADVKVSCGTLPCDHYIKDSLVPCVVCSY